MDSSLHRVLVAEPGGGSFTGTSEKRREGIPGFLFWGGWDPEDIKSKVWGPPGTLARNRAPLS